MRRIEAGKGFCSIRYELFLPPILLLFASISQRVSSHQRLRAVACAAIAAVCLSWGVLFGFSQGVRADGAIPAVPSYTWRDRHNPDGIGKFSCGREIAKVMGHTEALWLERPDRAWQEQPDRAIAALALQPDNVVADLGAGYFSFRLAAQVPQGKVLAVDVQPQMLDMLAFLQQERGVSNIVPIAGDPDNPHLPTQAIDLALLVDADREFAYPCEMMRRVVAALKPGGRVALVEYRGENLFIPSKGLHKMTLRQLRRVMAAVGLTLRESLGILPTQHLAIFGRAGA